MVWFQGQCFFIITSNPEMVLLLVSLIFTSVNASISGIFFFRALCTVLNVSYTHPKTCKLHHKYLLRYRQSNNQICAKGTDSGNDNQWHVNLLYRKIKLRVHEVRDVWWMAQCIQLSYVVQTLEKIDSQLCISPFYLPCWLNQVAYSSQLSLFSSFL